MKHFLKSIRVLVLSLATAVTQAQSSVVVVPLTDGDANNLENIVTVATANGDFTSPVAAVDSIPTAGPEMPSATNRYLVIIGPGEFNIGKQRITMKEWVSIQGSGREATLITGAASTAVPDETSAIVAGASNAALSDLSIENTGGDENAFAIYNIWAFASPRIERVNAHAQGGSAINVGIRNRETASPIMTDVKATASGGLTAIGLSLHQTASALTNIAAEASGGSLSNYGVSIYSAPATLRMTNISATALGNKDNYGIYISNSSPVMTNISTRGWDGTGDNYGIYILGSSSPFIQGSSMEGKLYGLWFDSNSHGSRIVNSKMNSVRDGTLKSIQCRETYNTALTDVPC